METVYFHVLARCGKVITLELKGKGREKVSKSDIDKVYLSEERNFVCYMYSFNNDPYYFFQKANNEQNCCVDKLKNKLDEADSSMQRLKTVIRKCEDTLAEQRLKQSLMLE